MYFPYNDIFSFFQFTYIQPKKIAWTPPPRQKSDLIYNIFFLHIKRFSGGGPPPPPPPLFSQSLNFVMFFLDHPLLSFHKILLANLPDLFVCHLTFHPVGRTWVDHFFSILTGPLSCCVVFLNPSLFQ